MPDPQLRYDVSLAPETIASIGSDIPGRIFSRTMVTTVRSSFGWRGTVRERIVSPTAAAVQALAHSVLPRSTVGPTMRTSTRLAGCSGPLSRNMARKLSWADLMILAGNVHSSRWGSKLLVSRADVKMCGSPQEDVYWGSEGKWLGDKRYTGDRELENPLGAVQMG